MVDSRSSVRSGAILCAMVLTLLCMPIRAADGGGGLGGLGHRDRGQFIDKALERINEGIERLQTGLANHPNAPDTVRNAAGKLVNDLNALKTELTKAQAALQGKDRAALQGLRGQFKTLRETIEADRQALKSAVQAARQR